MNSNSGLFVIHSVVAQTHDYISVKVEWRNSFDFMTSNRANAAQWFLDRGWELVHTQDVAGINAEQFTLRKLAHAEEIF